MKNIFLIFALLINMSVFSQNETTQTKIINYLNNTVKYKSNLLVNTSNQSVIDAEILKAGLYVNLGDKYGDDLIFKSYFLKNGNNFTAFESPKSILLSQEFIDLLKKKKFKLKEEEDGIALQTLLCLLDKYKPLGFSNIDNTWYFKRDKFFDDLTVYIIKTDKKGSVISIEYKSRLKMELPKTLKGIDKKQKFDKIKNVIIDTDSVFTHKYLLEKADYVFNSAKVEMPVNLKNSTIYYCDFKTTQVFSDGVSSTTSRSFMLMNENGHYKKFKSGKELMKSSFFRENILGSISINNEQEAKLFQDVIDIINPVDKSFRISKKFYLKDGIWFFLRNERFDDMYAYMLKTDEKGVIKYLSYSSITDEAILRFKMKDPSYRIDYKFKLISPTQNKITIKKGEGLNVEISFDEGFVNAKGAWILTRIDGKKSGMMISSTMESPYTNKIPSSVLKNKSHIVEYLLLKSGGTDIENALGVIKINIEVK